MSPPGFQQLLQALRCLWPFFHYYNIALFESRSFPFYSRPPVYQQQARCFQPGRQQNTLRNLYMNSGQWTLSNDDCCIHGGGLEIPRCECGRFVKWELLKTDFSQLADLIDNSKRIVFLTGAGVSVASGLPTYTNDDGERDPATFDSSSPEYRVITEELEGLIKGASPCNAHKLPKVLLDPRKDTYVITQNVDGLYQRPSVSRPVGAECD